MTPALVIGLFNALAPIVRDIIAAHKARTGTDTLPTDAEMTAAFTANIDKYLGEAAAWRAAHPPTP